MINFLNNRTCIELVNSMIQVDAWERVGIAVRPGKNITKPMIRGIFKFLLDKGSRVYVSGIPREQLPNGIETCSLESLDVDLLITIGGDGTQIVNFRIIVKNG